MFLDSQDLCLIVALSNKSGFICTDGVIRVIFVFENPLTAYDLFVVRKVSDEPSICVIERFKFIKNGLFPTRFKQGSGIRSGFINSKKIFKLSNLCEEDKLL